MPDPWKDKIRPYLPELPEPDDKYEGVSNLDWAHTFMAIGMLAGAAVAAILGELVGSGGWLVVLAAFLYCILTFCHVGVHYEEDIDADPEV